MEADGVAVKAHLDRPQGIVALRRRVIPQSATAYTSGTCEASNVAVAVAVGDGVGATGLRVGPSAGWVAGIGVWLGLATTVTRRSFREPMIETETRAAAASSKPSAISSGRSAIDLAMPLSSAAGVPSATASQPGR